MNKQEEILNKIIDWANNEELVRGLIMLGSRALNQSDELSDFDISVFVKDKQQFTDDDSWLSKIANIWVYSPDKYTWNDVIVPTRLVIYESGAKVDFSLWDTDVIKKLSESDFFDTGFKVVLDKDKQLSDIKHASLNPTIPQKPTEQEFTHIITEFWFEAYHVAKYLKREDLWLVKFRDWSLHVYLLTMMEWYMLAKNNWDYDVKWTGKNIKKWLEAEVYNRLSEIFSHFETQDSWRALEARLNLFRDLSKETARLLAYHYPEEMDKNLTNFILNLRK